MPPAPNLWHQDFEYRLESWLRRHCTPKHGTKVYHNVNVAPSGGWSQDYRIPDLVLIGPSSRAVEKEDHVEGPPDVVIEIRSPGDETIEKLPFYAALGVPEVWVLDRDTRVPTVYVLKEGDYKAKSPGAQGLLASDVVGVELRSAGPGRLCIRLTGDDASREEIAPN